MGRGNTKLFTIFFENLNRELSVCILPGSVPEGVRAQTELLRPRRDQMGAVHRTLRTLRDKMLNTR